MQVREDGPKGRAKGSHIDESLDHSNCLQAEKRIGADTGMDWSRLRGGGMMKMIICAVVLTRATIRFTAIAARLLQRRQFRVIGISVFAKDMCHHDFLVAA